MSFGALGVFVRAYPKPTSIMIINRDEDVSPSGRTSLKPERKSPRTTSEVGYRLRYDHKNILPLLLLAVKASRGCFHPNQR